MDQDEIVEFDNMYDIRGSIVFLKVGVGEPGSHIDELMRLVIPRNAVRWADHSDG